MPISGLSGLRGFAMILIVIYHLHQVRSVEGLALWDWMLYQFTALLPVVVCIFFILGGFLRSLSYWKALEEGGRAPLFWKGMKDRWWRIAPLYYISLILSFFWMVYLGIPDWKSFFAGFTFLSWSSPDTFFPAAKNGPLWFVAYDMIGNIIVMIIMSAIIFMRQKIPVHSRMVMITGFILAFLALLGLHFGFISIPWELGQGIASSWFPYYNPFIFGIQYLMGAVLGGVYFRYKNIEKSILGDFIVGVMFFAIIYFLLSILGATDLAYSWPLSPYRFPTVPIFIALLIGALLFAQYVPKWLDNRFFLFFAAISYPLYLTHALVIDILRHIVFGYAPLTHGKWEIFIIVVLIIVLPLAWGLLRLEGWMIGKTKK